MEQNSFLISDMPQDLFTGYAEPPAAMTPVKPHYEPKPHDHLYAWLCLPLGFVFMRYVLNNYSSYLTTAVFLVLHLLGMLYIRRSGCKQQLSQRIFGAVLCIFAAVFSITSSRLVDFMCILFLLAGEVWRIHAVCGGIPFVTRYFPLDLASSLGKPLSTIGAAPAALADSAKHSRSMKSVRTVILSLLITIPLTVAVGMLLSSADSGMQVIFEKIGNLFTRDAKKMIFEMLCGIPVGFILFGIWFSGAERRENGFLTDEEYADTVSSFRIISNLSIYAGITPICLMYLAYIFTQTSYFFSAFAGKLPSDMIYSEYARRGFFELCAIAVINLIVILVVNGCAKDGGEKRSKMLTLYVTVLCGCTLFIISTAIAKILLYIHAYGLTRQRLFTTWFMLLLGIGFICLILRQFIRRFPTAAVFSAAFIGMFGLFCFSRTDALIAEYNLTRYEQGTLKELDVNALSALSDDAYGVMMQHMDTIRAAGKLPAFLPTLMSRGDNLKNEDFRRWNLSSEAFLSDYLVFYDAWRAEHD